VQDVYRIVDSNGVAVSRNGEPSDHVYLSWESVKTTLRYLAKPHVMPARGIVPPFEPEVAHLRWYPAEA
jgi:hypothetical protein